MDIVQKEKKFLNYYIFSVVLAFLTLVVSSSIFVGKSIGIDSTGFFGIPLKRIVIIVLLLVLAAIVLIGGISGSRKYQSLNLFFMTIPNKLRFWLKIIVFLLFLWGLVSLSFPTVLFGNFKGYFWLQKPLSLSLSFIIFECWFLMRLEKRVFFIQDLKNLTRQVSIPFILSFCIFIAFGAFIYFTKIGLVYDTAFWNVPGIPLTGLQFFAILVSMGVILEVTPKLSFFNNPKTIKILLILLPIVVFVSTFLLWGFTPMTRHFFSLEPTPPNYQPFPFSDARSYDLGALSILKGQGILFKTFTDKPLYMIYLAILHLFAGDNYNQLIWLNLITLSFIPVVMYFIGKAYYNPVFGISLAAIVIIQQRNAILLSYKVASVNPKTLITEELTLLGIALIVYLLFSWVRTGKQHYALLLGGVIGAASLVRFTPVLLFPTALVFCIIFFRKNRRIFWKQFLLISLGFLVVYVPYIVSSVSPDGKSLIIDKMEIILRDRYKATSQVTEMISSQPGSAEWMDSKPSGLIAKSKPILLTREQTKTIKATDFGKIGQYSYLIMNHFLHNISTSILSLPDAPVSENLETIRQRPYWIEQSGWDGSFPGDQVLIIVSNLVMVSAGIAYAWKKFRFSGLVPLLVFLVYDLVLSLSINSGSRYIVPIDWIYYFYLLFGFLFLFDFFKELVGNPTKRVTEHSFETTIVNSNNKKAMVSSIIAIILIAMLIPISNFVIPAIHSNVEDSNIANHSPNSVSAPENLEWIKGEILYPYYQVGEQPIITFDLLSGSTITSFNIEQSGFIDADTTLEAEETVWVGVKKSNDLQEVKYIYLVVGEQQSLIWAKNKQKP